MSVDITHEEVETHGELSETDYEQKHKTGLISPAEEYLPITTRIIGVGTVYYEDPYFISRSTVALNVVTSCLAFGKLFHFGTYEWKGKVKNAVAKATIYLGILERHHGWYSEGLIAVMWDGVLEKYYFITSEGGNIEQTEITGIDFTQEHTFKIEWTATEVKLYIDGILKLTHSQANAVPQHPMQLFFETLTHDATPPASEPYCYFRNRSFKELP